jgi:hypothetical protein
MKAAALAAATGAAGVLGGVVGALLAGGGGPAAPAAPAPAPAAADPAAEALAKEVASLRARLEEMQASVVHASAETTRLKEEVAAERKEAAAREKAAAAGGLHHRLRGLRPVPGKDVSTPQLLEEGDASVFVMAGADGTGLPERFRKAMELRRKTEEERWAAAREALGLNATQEEELKAALKERNEASQGAMKITTTENVAPDGTKSTSMNLALPDPAKVEEARKRYDDRVAATLTQDQAKKWKDDGYEQAMGGGMGIARAAIMDVEVGDGGAK